MVFLIFSLIKQKIDIMPLTDYISFWNKIFLYKYANVYLNKNFKRISFKFLLLSFKKNFLLKMFIFNKLEIIILKTSQTIKNKNK